MKVVGLGTSPATAAVQFQQQNRMMQNAATKQGGRRKYGGDVEVTQFPNTGLKVSNQDSNTAAVNLANMQQTSNSLLNAQSSVGKPVSGGRRSRRRSRRRKTRSLFCRIFGL